MATGDVRPRSGINHAPLLLPAKRCSLEVNVTMPCHRANLVASTHPLAPSTKYTRDESRAHPVKHSPSKNLQESTDENPTRSIDKFTYNHVGTATTAKEKTRSRARDLGA